VHAGNGICPVARSCISWKNTVVSRAAETTFSILARNCDISCRTAQIQDAMRPVIRLLMRRISNLLLSLPTTPVILEYVCGATTAGRLFGLPDCADQLNGSIVSSWQPLSVWGSSSRMPRRLDHRQSSFPAPGRAVVDFLAGASIAPVAGPHDKQNLSTAEASESAPGEEAALAASPPYAGTPAASSLAKWARPRRYPHPSPTKRWSLRTRGNCLPKLTCFQKSTSTLTRSRCRSWKLPRLGHADLIMDRGANPADFLTSGPGYRRQVRPITPRL